jgi:hypothetical protein
MTKAISIISTKAGQYDLNEAGAAFDARKSATMGGGDEAMQLF